jgi:hypothetical protein
MLAVEAEADCPDSVDTELMFPIDSLALGIAFFTGTMVVFVAGAVEFFVKVVGLFVEAVTFFVKVGAADFVDMVGFLMEVVDFMEVAGFFATVELLPLRPQFLAVSRPLVRHSSTARGSSLMVGSAISLISVGDINMSSILVDNSVEVAHLSARTRGSCASFLGRASESVY